MFRNELFSVGPETSLTAYLDFKNNSQFLVTQFF